MDNTRYSYSPLITRKPFKLPKGARVALWVESTLNICDIGFD